MTDALERRRALQNSLARKAILAVKLSRFQDEHFREPNVEEAQRLAVEAGVREPDPLDPDTLAAKLTARVGEDGRLSVRDALAAAVDATTTDERTP